MSGDDEAKQVSLDQRNQRAETSGHGSIVHTIARGIQRVTCSQAPPAHRRTERS